ncbi:MAG: hypothetical protein ACE5FZ_04970 [Nitrospiria bacterium]
MKTHNKYNSRPSRAVFFSRLGGRVLLGIVCALLIGIGGGRIGFVPSSNASHRDASKIEVIRHGWRPGEVWDKIGRTKFFWDTTVRNNSDERKRVYAYYDLLDENGFPLARNVSNKYVGPHETVEIIADSYIMTVDLPKVTSSRVTVKVGLN